MLATVTIASQQHSFIGVWLGSTLGVVVADGIAIVVGKVMGKRLPEKAIKYGAALVFIASGVFTLREAFAGGRSFLTHGRPSSQSGRAQAR